MKRKEEKQILGWEVSNRIRELVALRVDKVQSENERLKREIERLEEVKAICKELKVDLPWLYGTRDRVGQAVSSIAGGGGLLGALVQVEIAAKAARSKLEDIQKRDEDARTFSRLEQS